MTVRAQAYIDFGAIEARSTRLRRKIERLVKSGVISEGGKAQQMVDGLEAFVVDLGRPQFTGHKLDPRRDATFQELNALWESIGSDHADLMEEYRGLANMITRYFNRNQAVLMGALGEAQNTAGRALTAALANDTPQRGQFLVVEDFSTQENMSPDSTAETGFGGGVLVLQRLSVENAIDAGAEITVRADQSSVVDILGQSNNDIDFRLPYEGKFFALLGEVQPEGGRLKFVTKNGRRALSPTPTELLRASRENIIDGSPESIWQIERVVRRSGDESVSPGDLDRDFPYDFSVELVIDLRAPTIASAITLDPINFGDRNWLEIADVATSLDGQNYETVPGLHDHQFYNVLTDEANKELTPRVANSILAPNKYRYTGDGLWVFPDREIRYVRMNILQRTPIEAPYEILVIKQKQTVKKTKTSGSILGFGGQKKTKTKTVTKDVELSYEESLLVFSGEQEVEETSASVKANYGPSFSLPGVGNIFSSGGTTVEKSGYKFHSARTEQRNDAVRYVIGIRDVEVLTTTFAPESTYISKPFEIPSPIRQVHFRADASVPFTTSVGEPIQYSLSFDGGSTWTRVANGNEPPRYSGGTRVPSVVLVNSGVPEDARDERFGYVETKGPVREVMVRIDLARPEGDPGTTPIVKKYALDIYTEETVSRINV